LVELEQEMELLGITGVEGKTRILANVLFRQTSGGSSNNYLIAAKRGHLGVDADGRQNRDGHLHRDLGWVQRQKTESLFHA
jgi:hypothetical protein